MKVKSYIYGYLKGSLSEAQLQGTFSDIARKMWWLLYVSNNHRACLREARVLPKSLGAIAFPARFSFKSARRRIKETRTTSCDWGLNFENHCLWSKSQGFWLDGGWQISPYRKYVFFLGHCVTRIPIALGLWYSANPQSMLDSCFIILLFNTSKLHRIKKCTGH